MGSGPQKGWTPEGAGMPVGKKGTTQWVVQDLFDYPKEDQNKKQGNLYITMSSAQRTIFFTAVTVKYMKKNRDITWSLALPYIEVPL